MASSLSKEKLTQFAMLLWSIWASRNAKVWNQVSDTSQQIKARARTMWGDWKSAQQVRIQTRNQRGNNTVATANVWIAPPPGSWKINVDATFPSQGRVTNFGVCLR